MIGSFINFGFLFPTLLIGIPTALGFLIYLYRRQGRQKKVVVSTLLFLREFARKVPTRQKFFPPLRFFIEFLLFILLVASLAGIFRKDQGERVALVIDNSFSMVALDYQSGRDMRIPEVVADSVRSRVRKLPQNSRIDLFFVAPRLEQQGENGLSSAALESLLVSSKLSYAPDRIENALVRLVRGGEYSSIEVFSDKIGEDRKFNITTLNFHPIIEELGSVVVGNTAITDLEIKNSGAASQLRVEIAAFTKDSVQLNLGVVMYRRNGGADQLPMRDVTLKAGETKSIDVTLPAGDVPALEARIEPRAGVGAVRADAIPQDNRAFISLSGRSENFTLVGDVSPEELGLKKIRGMNFDHLSPAEFTQKTSSGDSRYIFYHTIPQFMPEGPALIIAPSVSSEFLNVLPVVNQVEVSRWLPSHFLTSYSKLAGLTFPKLTPLEVPSWGEGVIQTPSGTALVAGEVAGRRIIATGFEILPYRGKGSPVLSVLLLNMLTWLADSSLGRSWESVPGFFEPSAPSDQVIPLNKTPLAESWKESGEESGAFSIAHPGIITALSDEGKKEFHAFNYFDSQESDLLMKQRIEIGEVSTASEFVEKSESNTLVFTIAWVALGVLLLDLIYQLFRWGVGRKRVARVL